MIWLTFIAALLSAPAKMAETRSADPRMECELLHVSGDGVAVPYCFRAGQVTHDGSATFTSAYVEVGHFFTWNGLGLRAPEGLRW